TVLGDSHSVPTRRSSDLRRSSRTASSSSSSPRAPSLKVPDVSGKTEEEARKIINDAKLQAGTHISQNSPDVDKGVVIETKPGDGDRKSTRLNSSHVSISY